MHEKRETSETPAVKPGSRSAGEGDSHTPRKRYPYRDRQLTCLKGMQNLLLNEFFK